jgi:serine/threonine-protein kinase RsbW
MSFTETLCNSSQFTQMDAVADPASVARVRRAFSDWLGRYFTLDATKVSDVVLAVNEAMANAAEYAYLAAERPGTMDVQAHYDRSAATLMVTVTDQGAWRAADPAKSELKRGRGLPLMHALADRATVDSSPVGTRVCLEWDQVSAATGTAAAAPPEQRTHQSAGPRS